MFRLPPQKNDAHTSPHARGNVEGARDEAVVRPHGREACKKMVAVGIEPTRARAHKKYLARLESCPLTTRANNLIDGSSITKSRKK